MKNIHVTIYTKEYGKLELTEEGWWEFIKSSTTYHREDGPAVIYHDGVQRFYLNDKFYTKEDYYKKLEEIDNLPLSLKLIHDEEWVRERAKK